MSKETRNRLKGSFEAAATVAAFWYLSRLLFSAFLQRAPVKDGAQVITHDNATLINVPSERDFATALLQVHPQEKIVHEPFLVRLEPHEYTADDRLRQTGTTPDFEVGDVIIVEVGHGSEFSQSKQAQAAVMQRASFIVEGEKAYIQICGEDLRRFLESDNRAQVLWDLTGGMLGYQ